MAEDDSITSDSNSDDDTVSAFADLPIDLPDWMANSTVTLDRDGYKSAPEALIIADFQQVHDVVQELLLRIQSAEALPMPFQKDGRRRGFRWNISDCNIELPQRFTDGTLTHPEQYLDSILWQYFRFANMRVQGEKHLRLFSFTRVVFNQAQNSVEVWTDDPEDDFTEANFRSLISQEVRDGFFSLRSGQLARISKAIDDFYQDPLKPSSISIPIEDIFGKHGMHYDDLREFIRIFNTLDKSPITDGAEHVEVGLEISPYGVENEPDCILFTRVQKK